jgi:hypothetical protein
MLAGIVLPNPIKCGAMREPMAPRPRKATLLMVMSFLI